MKRELKNRRVIKSSLYPADLFLRVSFRPGRDNRLRTSLSKLGKFSESDGRSDDGP